jgi:hypothetical protein
MIHLMKTAMLFMDNWCYASATVQVCLTIQRWPRGPRPRALAVL